jgi:hypothetical protein
MRRIHSSPTTLSTLVGALVSLAACSSPPTAPSTSSGTPESASPSLGTALPAARSLSLSGDGHALQLKGAPADPSYIATYPVSGFNSMTVTAGSYGDLTATCQSGGGAAKCTSLPFFSQVGSSAVNVYDAFGKIVIALPVSPIIDAGVLPSLPSGGFDAGAGTATGNGTIGGNGSAGIADDAGAGCTPSVSASFSGCSLTVGGTTCDCSDVACATGAIEACLGSTGVLTGLPLDDGGFPGTLPDAGLFGTGSPFSDDAGALGSMSAACTSAAIASAQAAFCSDVDAAAAAQGLSATLDCAALGTLSFPTTPPATSATAVTCDQLTHDAFAKVRAALATCDPLDYIGWNSSAELQLFDDGACTVW